MGVVVHDTGAIFCFASSSIQAHSFGIIETCSVVVDSPCVGIVAPDLTPFSVALPHLHVRGNVWVPIWDIQAHVLIHDAHDATVGTPYEILVVSAIAIPNLNSGTIEGPWGTIEGNVHTFMLVIVHLEHADFVIGAITPCNSAVQVLGSICRNISHRALDQSDQCEDAKRHLSECCLFAQC